MHKLKTVDGSEIDKAFTLKEKIDNLKKEYDTIINYFKEMGLEKGEYFGDVGKLSIGERIDSNLSPKKAFKLLGETKFIEIVKVVKKEAEKYLSKSQMDKISEEPVITQVYTIKEKK